jgi:hypothetical protein
VCRRPAGACRWKQPTAPTRWSWRTRPTQISESPRPLASQLSISSLRKETELTFEDLSLLCDLFYLPFEHGGQGLQLLQEFNWLKSNAHVVIAANQKKDASRSEVSFRRRRCTVVAPVR